MQLCTHCYTGRIESRKVVFVKQHSKQTVVVDWLPASVCSSCGQKSYDRRALEHLQRLLWSPNGEKQSLQNSRISNA